MNRIERRFAAPAQTAIPSGAGSSARGVADRPGERRAASDGALVTYEGPNAPRFEPGEGLRWTCTWDNPTDVDFEFGPFTDTNEHCNLFAFYYPAIGRNEATYCVKKDGVNTTTVRSNP